MDIKHITLGKTLVLIQWGNDHIKSYSYTEFTDLRAVCK